MKRTPNRKRRAIRCIVIAVMLTLLYNSYGWGQLFFPRQTLRHQEEIYGTGRTEILYTCPDFGAGGIVYLSANENAMLVTRSRPSLWGWQAENIVLEDCTETAAIRCGLRTFRRWDWEDYGKTGVTYWYGRVEDPSITEVQLTCQTAMRAVYDSTVIPGTERSCTVTTTQESWREADGCRYFLVRLEPLDTQDTRAEYQHIVYTALDAAGDVVVKVQS